MSYALRKELENHPDSPWSSDMKIEQAIRRGKGP